ncbi:hypothetical protein [Paenibacillus polymyxa]|uniref:hypothetical protein n=1 Tax=Paenibacillus polymyxa TaxID=1406 RepID=UPI00131A3DD1|nr:hypothetical protein [Paenibacillus polymyxa]
MNESFKKNFSLEEFRKERIIKKETYVDEMKLFTDSLKAFGKNNFPYAPSRYHDDEEEE